ncbi:hypothetical protein [Anabaenopsis elenkinii]|uniref:Uncharacterized protein n=1 Tax=Anabaenopsis elenkinii CCIBt3563 TaxID=2779889 RepID=A0A7S6RDY5_9CYAN|nr:hypothetical protein [Anabaenopsis elenkinii]QOV23088.1 hypothetical protein IM676_01665 [Anabaenopsis elenkinii CCIBt3563]
MSGSFYCLDNDIILKLATCDLFNETLTTFEINASQIQILDSFKYKFDVNRQIKRTRGNKSDNNYTKFDIKKALEIVENCVTLSEHNPNIDRDIYLKLMDSCRRSNDKTDTIDQGEAILISYIFYLSQQGYTNNYLLTHDKCCLRALIKSGLTEIIENLEGRIWCLEQLIFKYIEKFGFDIIQTKVYPSRYCDQNIKMIFGYSIKATEEVVKENLNREIIVLRRETGNLLYPYP